MTIPTIRITAEDAEVSWFSVRTGDFAGAITPDKSASVALTRSGRDRFEADVVVHRIAKPLLTAEVSLRRLDAHISEQKLNLLKLPLAS